MACLSVSAAQAGEHAYLYTLRLGHGLLTALDCDGERALVGMTGGMLMGLQLLRGSKAAAAHVAREVGNMASKGVNAAMLDAVTSGVVEFSDDEDEEDEEESEDD